MTEKILQLNNEFIGNNGTKTLFVGLVSGLAVMFLLYSYLVGSIIFSVVARKDTEAKTREQRSAVGVLEVEYLKLAGQITLERAHALGFKEATSQVFAARKSAGLSLTTSGE